MHCFSPVIVRAFLAVRAPVESHMRLFEFHGISTGYYAPDAVVRNYFRFVHRPDSAPAWYRFITPRYWLQKVGLKETPPEWRQKHLRSYEGHEIITRLMQIPLWTSRQKL